MKINNIIKQLILRQIFCLIAVINIGFVHCQIPGLSGLIKKVDPSIIKIYTIYDLNSNEKSGQGSGVILTNNGECVTNYHVLIGAKRAVAVTSDGKEFDITKINDYSKANDLVKFQIEIPNQKLNPIILNPIIPMKGDNVFTVGYPIGFTIPGESTLSTGIISGIREENGEKIIQTSAPYTHGSSGGGLFDSYGKLLGITQGTFAEDIKDRHANLNRAIPTNLINKLNRKLNLTLSQFYDEIRESENFVIAMIAYENLDFETAADYFSRHLDEYPEDALAWMRLGICSMQLSKKAPNKKEEILGNALICLNFSISLDTSNFYSWGQAALAYCSLGNIDQAKFYAAHAYEINSNISFTNYVFGKIASASKDFDMAILFFTETLKLALEIDFQLYVHQWYLERAIAYDWIKDYFKAESDFNSCLKLNSSNLDGWFWYGNSLSKQKRYSEACEAFRKLKNLSPQYKNSGYSVDQMLKYNRCGDK